MSTTTPLNLYDTSIPVFTRTLTNLHAILTKASSDSKVSQLDLSTLRIHENMLAFPRQIQIACDTAKFYPVRVASHSDISFPDTETTLSDLLSRIQKTIDFLKEVKKEEFDDKLDVEVVVMNKFKFTGLSYTTAYSLPNFFFHVTTAYDILRMNGLDIGKLDYLGNVDQFTIKDQ